MPRTFARDTPRHRGTLAACGVVTDRRGTGRWTLAAGDAAGASTISNQYIAFEAATGLHVGSCGGVNQFPPSRSCAMGFSFGDAASSHASGLGRKLGVWPRSACWSPTMWSTADRRPERASLRLAGSLRKAPQAMFIRLD